MVEFVFPYNVCMLADCPMYWQNFVKDLVVQKKPDELSSSCVDNELTKYNGLRILSDGVRTKKIVFKTEADATYFMLKWG